jgi:hypothetical protein
LRRKLAYIEYLARCCECIGALVRCLEPDSGAFRIIPPRKEYRESIPVFYLSDKLVTEPGEYPFTVLYETVITALAVWTEATPSPELLDYECPEDVPAISSQDCWEDVDDDLPTLIDDVDDAGLMGPSPEDPPVTPETVQAILEQRKRFEDQLESADFVPDPSARATVCHVLASSGQRMPERQINFSDGAPNIVGRLWDLLGISPAHQSLLWWQLFTDLWTTSYRFRKPGTLYGGDNPRRVGTVLDGVGLQWAFFSVFPRQKSRIMTFS